MLKWLIDIIWLARGVRVFALVGESGSGKSFRAKLVAQKYGIDLLIDDGLLIKGENILAGRSAKKEQLYMAAVKTALFHDKFHRDEVAKALQKLHFKKILVMGTSQRMVEKICEQLQLPQPWKVIKIQEIASHAEIEKAMNTRKIEGKHVIPVPAIEIRRNYPQIFYDSVRVFLQRSFGNPAITSPRVYEKSVVRPQFSKRGRVSISEVALSQMVVHCVDEYDEKLRVKKVSVRSDSRGYRLTLSLEVPFGTQLSGTIHGLQQNIIENIERFTGILIEEVNILVDRFASK